MKERDRQQNSMDQFKTLLFFIDSEKYKAFFPSEYKDEEDESELIEDSELPELDRLLRTLNKTGVLTAQDLEEGWV